MKEILYPRDSEGTLYEDLVMATVLLWPASIAMVTEYLRPEHFYKTSNKDYWAFLLDSYGRNSGEMNLSEFLEAFGAKNEELAKMVAGTSYVVTTQMLLRNARKVIEAKQYRDLMQIGENVKADAVSQKGSIQEITSYYASLLSSIDEEIAIGAGINHVAQSLLEEVKQEERGELVRMQTGLDVLDRMNGGIWGSVVLRVCAYANTGKSTFLYYVTRNLVVQGYCGMYFSTEVKSSRVLAMLLASHLGVPYRDIFSGAVDFGAALEDFSGLRIYDNKRTIEEICMEVVKHQPQFIVIDYLQELNHNIQDEYTRMAHVAAQIRQLSIQHNVVVIDASQVPNDWQLKKGILPAKGSGDLSASCDVGLLLSVDEAGIMTVDIRKNKFGVKVDFCLLPDFERVRFTPTTPKTSPYRLD